MSTDRRQFLAASASLIAATNGRAAAPEGPKPRPTRIGVSTYSFWQFKNDKLRDVETCIDLAGEMGFDAVEILHRQMTDETAAGMQKLKRRTFLNGMSLCGFSIHQGFVFPDKETRQKNVHHTIKCLEMCYAMGIPTMRVNTGRWGTIKSFDDLMKARGVEPNLPGVSDDDGFKWVIDGLTACLKTAEKCGVVMGLEN